MKVESREDIGSNKVKKIRVNNIIPGVIYSRGQESKIVEITNQEFTRVFKAAGSSSVINLDLKGEAIPVIVKSIQRHPVTGFITHVDFQKLNMTEKIKMSIPIVLLNRDSIKIQPSILLQLLDQVEIECLPSYIPHTADVDVSDLDFTTPKYVRDTDIAKMEGITILTELDEPVCHLSAPLGEEPEETVAAKDGADVPVVGEKA